MTGGGGLHAGGLRPSPPGAREAQTAGPAEVQGRAGPNAEPGWEPGPQGSGPKLVSSGVPSEAS